MGVEIPLERGLSVRRPKLVIDERAMTLAAPASLQEPLVLPLSDIVGIWAEPDRGGDRWSQALETPFWFFVPGTSPLPDVAVVLRRPIDAPTMKKLHHRDPVHPTATLLAFATADHTAAVEAFRRAGLRLLDQVA